MLVVFAIYETRISEPILPLAVFKNRIVGIALFVTLLTGFAMFGAIFFVPLLFQGVLGASPTASGSFLTPMMLGIVAGAAISGQVLSKTGGHYRIQGMIGLSIMAIGTFMLSQVNGDTTHAYALTSAVIMGFGLGTSFPLYTIAIQNGVPQQYLGVATSSAQFFRSVGGAIGLAVFGSYMVRQFKDGMQENLPDEVFETVPPKTLELITNNPNALLNAESSNILREAFAASGEAGEALGEQVFGAIRESLAGSIGDVFFLSFIFVVLGVIATAFIREVPLRKRGGPSGEPDGGLPGGAAPESKSASTDSE